MILVDKFNRQVDLIQLAASASCQYDCSYCAIDKTSVPAPHLFPTENILTFIRMMAKLGLKRVRISGGEPLLRPDIIDLVSQLTVIQSIKSVSLSTNGLLLESMAERLSNTGLSRLFVSVPTLSKSLFKSMTGSDDLKKILTGLDAVIKMDCLPLTIKMPVVQGVNDHEIESIVDWAITRKINIYLVESQSGKVASQQMREPIISRLSKKYELTRLEGLAITNNPWKVEGTDTTIKIITCANKRECSTCNRLWLSSDGIISLCSGMPTTLDLNPIFENGASREELERVAVKIALNKPNGVANCGAAPLTYPELTN